MSCNSHLFIFPEVATALATRTPVVALESTVIAHGLPWPTNLDTARTMEAAVRAEGAMPATIAVWRGQPVIGVTDDQLEALAREPNVLKASRRDLGLAIAQGRTAATTVAATMALAYQAGIRVFATGGIGGAHRDPAPAWDISADLIELGRTPVAVICAGAKSILDVPRTLEILETHGVPVLGYETNTFPAFYLPSSGVPVNGRVDTPADAARALAAHWQLGGAGVVIAQPLSAEAALNPDEFQVALAAAERSAILNQIRGPALTPFLLRELATLTQGRTLAANQTLLINNARLAAQIAQELLGSAAA
jgi:pseudouridine-5'-phosphate glycosidase